MGYSFLITAREGLEAGLIVAIVLGYLARTDQRRYWPHILLGTALALVGSVAVGAALEATASELSGKAQEAFEGGAMLFAVAVLTSMIFWMKRQASTMGAHMRQRVDVAIRSGAAPAPDWRSPQLWPGWCTPGARGYHCGASSTSPV